MLPDTSAANSYTAWSHRLAVYGGLPPGTAEVPGVLVGTGPRIREVFVREFVGTFQSTHSHGVAPTGSRSLQRVIAKAALTIAELSQCPL